MLEISNIPKPDETILPGDPHAQPGADAVVPWEMIEAGRYRPRRIRGSCLGRELG